MSHRTRQLPIVHVSKTGRGYAVRSLRDKTRYFYGQHSRRRATAFATGLQQRQARRRQRAG